MENVEKSSSAGSLSRDCLGSVQGQITFVRRADEIGPEAVPPVRYAHLPFVNHGVTVRNARSIAGELSIDKEGLALIKRKVPSLSESDPKDLRKRYLDDMVPFIKDYFKASWVNTVDLGGLTIRSIGGNKFSSTASGAEYAEGTKLVRIVPAAFAHIDYAPVAGPMMAARDSQLQGIEIRSYSRLMIIQAWHAISAPPQDFPLAFCDASTISDADIFLTHSHAYGVTSITQLLHYNPAHRWYYLPDMTQDEFWLFKGYDSAMHDKRWPAHSAFDNRTAYPHAIPRESIESRFYVYYE